MSRGQRGRPELAAQVTADVVQHCAAAFGRDRIETTDVFGATTVRRRPIGREPLLLLVVNGLGDVSLMLDNFDHDGDWRAAIDTLTAPRIADVHRTSGGVHGFVLDGPGGALLFTAMGERCITDADTEGWLRTLPGWPSAG